MLLPRGAAAIYLVVTTPKSAAPIRFPLTAVASRSCSRTFPPRPIRSRSIPSAALLHGKLLANPVTREPILQWTHEHELPRPWMLGGADSRSGSAARSRATPCALDPFRALLVRTWLLIEQQRRRAMGGLDADHARRSCRRRRPRRRAISTTCSGSRPGLPEGDVFVVQRRPDAARFLRSAVRR